MTSEVAAFSDGDAKPERSDPGEGLARTRRRPPVSLSALPGLQTSFFEKTTPCKVEFWALRRDEGASRAPNIRLLKLYKDIFISCHSLCCHHANWEISHHDDLRDRLRRHEHHPQSGGGGDAAAYPRPPRRGGTDGLGTDRDPAAIAATDFPASQIARRGAAGRALPRGLVGVFPRHRARRGGRVDTPARGAARPFRSRHCPRP